MFQKCLILAYSIVVCIVNIRFGNFELYILWPDDAEMPSLIAYLLAAVPCPSLLSYGYTLAMYLLPLVWIILQFMFLVFHLLAHVSQSILFEYLSGLSLSTVLSAAVVIIILSHQILDEMGLEIQICWKEEEETETVENVN